MIEEEQILLQNTLYVNKVQQRYFLNSEIVYLYQCFELYICFVKTHVIRLNKSEYQIENTLPDATKFIKILFILISFNDL